MTDYYRYLWSTTWPNLIVLFLIWGFVLSRLVWKFVRTWRYEHDGLGFFLLTWKILVWVLVLGIYTELFLFSQPDWFFQPGYFQGSVLSKTYDSRLRSYLLEVHSSKEQEQFFIDQNVYNQVKIKDEVKLMYLPERREVVRCELR
jgi:hypothetical protein